MASEPKTRPTGASVPAFLATVPDARKRRDSEVLVRLMEKLTGAKATMWGPNIVGFGTYRLTYATGKSFDWPLAAFSPRSTALVLYLEPEFATLAELLAKLGPHRHGKSCLYLKTLDDVDGKVLERMVRDSIAHTRKHRAAAPETRVKKSTREDSSSSTKKAARKPTAKKSAAKRR